MVHMNHYQQYKHNKINMVIQIRKCFPMLSNNQLIQVLGIFIIIILSTVLTIIYKPITIMIIQVLDLIKINKLSSMEIHIKQKNMKHKQII